MKKYLSMASCLLAGALVVSSCGDDNDDNTPGSTASAEVQAIEQLSKKYVEDVVFPTYASLASSAPANSPKPKSTTSAPPS